MRLIAGLIATALLGTASYQARGAANAIRDGWPPYEEARSVPAASAIPFFHGIVNREMLADWYWVQALIYYGSRRIGHSDFVYLNNYIDAVLAADPKFRRVYLWAAYAVTYKSEKATQEEYRTSVRYLERGIKEYPDSYELFWHLGLRYYLDLEADTPEQKLRYRERAVDMIEQAMRKPDAPPNLPTLATSLSTKIGQNARAERSLREMILVTRNKRARERMIARYAALVRSHERAALLEEASERFERDWKKSLPYAPATLYVLVGDRPSPIIEFDQLATERDLYGAESNDDQ